jgi:tRNA dimethylallyltransferase
MAMRPSLPSLVVIAGPTASGKSALALALAERTGGVLVNADSAQIYRDLPILSAAPTAEERGRADHRLYGVLDGESPCSAAQWAELAKGEIEDIHGSGRLPIIVGGTGLYIRTLLDGIAPVPVIDPEIRREVRTSATADNYTRLLQLDPEAAHRLRATDTTRVARALEVAVSTGKPLHEWQEERVGGIGNNVELKPLLPLPPRDWLYERCDRRFVEMVKRGAVAEVRQLLSRQFDPDLPVMRAIGVPELGGFISGQTSIEEAIASGQVATRRYAKRQYTWFAHQPPSEWPRFTPPLDEAGIKEAVGRLLA